MDHPLPTETLDAPIFDPRAFRLTPLEAELTSRAREFGRRVLAPRAAKWDREAAFPIDNYRDMHAEGWLGVCIPTAEGGLGADFRAYCLAAAELGRHCGATALTWNMHVCSTLWTGLLTDDLLMDDATRAEHQARRAIHYRRILDDGAFYSQPFSEGGAAASGAAAFGKHLSGIDVDPAAIGVGDEVDAALPDRGAQSDIAEALSGAHLQTRVPQRWQRRRRRHCRGQHETEKSHKPHTQPHRVLPTSHDLLLRVIRRDPSDSPGRATHRRGLN